MTRRRDSGQATLELIGMVPMVLFVAMLTVQTAIAGSVLVMTEGAARSGARSQGQYCNGVQVAEQAPPAWLRDDSAAFQRASPAGTATIEVRSRIPVVFSGINLPLPVVRSATFPITGDC